VDGDDGVLSPSVESSYTVMGSAGSTLRSWRCKRERAEPASDHGVAGAHLSRNPHLGFLVAPRAGLHPSCWDSVKILRRASHDAARRGPGALRSGQIRVLASAGSICVAVASRENPSASVSPARTLGPRRGCRANGEARTKFAWDGGRRPRLRPRQCRISIAVKKSSLTPQRPRLSRSVGRGDVTARPTCQPVAVYRCPSSSW
jgi:hypothetical protein